MRWERYGNRGNLGRKDGIGMLLKLSLPTCNIPSDLRMRCELLGIKFSRIDFKIFYTVEVVIIWKGHQMWDGDGGYRGMWDE